LPQPLRGGGGDGIEILLEVLTACLSQAINDEYQHFGNMIAAKLINY